MLGVIIYEQKEATVRKSTARRRGMRPVLHPAGHQDRRPPATGHAPPQKNLTGVSNRPKNLT